VPDHRWTTDPEIDTFLSTMTLPSEEVLASVESGRTEHERTAPKMGDEAPDFVAEPLSPSKDLAHVVRLSDFRGQYLALLFGSYTCPIFRGQIKRYQEIYDELKDRCAFLLIYIREAHPEDGWQVGINLTQGTVFHQPRSMNARRNIAEICREKMALTIPMALDAIENPLDALYSASPERLYLLDSDGIVKHRSSPGPFAMNEIEDWYRAIKKSI